MKYFLPYLKLLHRFGKLNYESCGKVEPLFLGENKCLKMWKDIFLQTFNNFSTFLQDFQIPTVYRNRFISFNQFFKRRVLLLVNYPQTSFMQLVYFVINVSAMTYPNEKTMIKCGVKNEFIKICLLRRSINKETLYKVLANFTAYLFTYSIQVFIGVEFFIYLKDALSGVRQFLSTKCSLKLMKIAFYSTFKALYILNIFKFLS